MIIAMVVGAAVASFALYKVGGASFKSSISAELSKVEAEVAAGKVLADGKAAVASVVARVKALL